MVFAYSIGFGAPKSSDMANVWAQKEGIPVEIASLAIERLKSETFTRGYKRPELVLDSILGFLNSPRPSTEIQWRSLIESLEQELNDIVSVLGEQHVISRSLRARICATLRDQPSIPEDVVNKLHDLSLPLYHRDPEKVKSIITQVASGATTNDSYIGAILKINEVTMIGLLQERALREAERGHARLAVGFASLADTICVNTTSGKMGPYRLQILRLLESLYDDPSLKGSFKRREKILRKGLYIAEIYHGKHHLETMRWADSLAGFLMTQDQFGEAASLSQSNYKTTAEILGRDSLVTFSHMNRYAFVLMNSGMMNKAEQVITEFMQSVTMLPEANPDLFYDAEEQLGMVYFHQGRYIDCIQKLEAIANAKYGSLDNIPLVAESFDLAHTLLAAHGKLENTDRVLFLLPKYATLLQVGLGRGVRHHVKIMLEAGEAMMTAGLEEMAEKYLLGSLAYTGQFLGIRDPNMLGYLEALADLYIRLERWGCAEKVIRASLTMHQWRADKSLARRKRALGHMTDLAYANERQGRPEVALTIMRRWKVQMIKSQLPVSLENGRWMAKLYGICGRCDKTKARLIAILRRANCMETPPTEAVSGMVQDLGVLIFIHLCHNKTSQSDSLLPQLSANFQSLPDAMQPDCLFDLISTAAKLKFKHLTRNAINYLFRLIELHATSSGGPNMRTVKLNSRVAALCEEHSQYSHSIAAYKDNLHILSELEIKESARLLAKFRSTSLLARQLIHLGRQDEVDILDREARELEEMWWSCERAKDDDENDDDDDDDTNKEEEEDEDEDWVSEQKGAAPHLSQHEICIAWHHANLGDWKYASKLILYDRALDVDGLRCELSTTLQEDVANSAELALKDENGSVWNSVFKTQGFEALWKATKLGHEEAKVSLWLREVKDISCLTRLNRDKGMAISLSFFFRKCVY